MKITIANLYPDLLNLYGDRGNIAVLCRRMEQRGIEAVVREYSIGETIDFDSADIIYLGGGSDKEQKTVCGELKKFSSEFKAYVEKGGCVLAVCGGNELLGEYYKTDSETVSALGILDIRTEYSDKRFIDNVIVESAFTGSTIVGFENHNGRMYTGDYEPLGTVRVGSGNNGEDSKEGFVYKNVTGTYLHGPLLPKNPALADRIIKSALKQRYNEDITLADIDDTFEMQAHNYCLERFG